MEVPKVNIGKIKELPTSDSFPSPYSAPNILVSSTPIKLRSATPIPQFKKDLEASKLSLFPPCFQKLGQGTFCLRKKSANAVNSVNLKPPPLVKSRLSGDNNNSPHPSILKNFKISIKNSEESKVEGNKMIPCFSSNGKLKYRMRSETLQMNPYPKKLISEFSQIITEEATLNIEESECNKLPDGRIISRYGMACELPPKSIGSKETIIVDLDSTLIFKPIGKECLKPSIYTSSITFTAKNVAYVQRPYLLDFLTTLKQMEYEIILYTASGLDYATDIIDSLQLPKFLRFPAILSRNNCHIVEDLRGRIFIKDLSLLRGRDNMLDRCIIIDDNISAWPFDEKKVIQIKGFFGDPNDNHLMHLIDDIKLRRRNNTVNIE